MSRHLELVYEDDDSRQTALQQFKHLKFFGRGGHALIRGQLRCLGCQAAACPVAASAAQDAPAPELGFWPCEANGDGFDGLADYVVLEANASLFHRARLTSAPDALLQLNPSRAAAAAGFFFLAAALATHPLTLRALSSPAGEPDPCAVDPPPSPFRFTQALPAASLGPWTASCSGVSGESQCWHAFDGTDYQAGLAAGARPREWLSRSLYDPGNGTYTGGEALGGEWLQLRRTDGQYLRLTSFVLSGYADPYDPPAGASGNARVLYVYGTESAADTDWVQLFDSPYADQDGAWLPLEKRSYVVLSTTRAYVAFRWVLVRIYPRNDTGPALPRPARVPKLYPSFAQAHTGLCGGIQGLACTSGTEGNYSCACGAGYRPNLREGSYPATCLDVDECALGAAQPTTRPGATSRSRTAAFSPTTGACTACPAVPGVTQPVGLVGEWLRVDLGAVYRLRGFGLTPSAFTCSAPRCTRVYVSVGAGDPPQHWWDAVQTSWSPATSCLPGQTQVALDDVRFRVADDIAPSAPAGLLFDYKFDTAWTAPDYHQDTGLYTGTESRAIGGVTYRGGNLVYDLGGVYLLHRLALVGMVGLAQHTGPNNLTLGIGNSSSGPFALWQRGLQVDWVPEDVTTYFNPRRWSLFLRRPCFSWPRHFLILFLFFLPDVTFALASTGPSSSWGSVVMSPGLVPLLRTQLFFSGINSIFVIDGKCDFGIDVSSQSERSLIGAGQEFVEKLLWSRSKCSSSHGARARINIP
eukprot:g43416.t1